jgi:hypothetical protein
MLQIASGVVNEPVAGTDFGEMEGGESRETAWDLLLWRGRPE